MIIAILKQVKGQKIPRPYTRASSRDELIELLPAHVQINFAAIDTDEPIVVQGVKGDIKFYAFTEQ